MDSQALLKHLFLTTNLYQQLTFVAKLSQLFKACVSDNMHLCTDHHEILYFSSQDSN